MDNSELAKNVKAIKKTIENLASSLEIKHFEIINNSDFYKKMNIVELFQKYGKLFNLNTMLSREQIKTRIDSGISYTEFSYQVFQAIDFLLLYEEKDVQIQIGGSDQ
jgi:tyrosyl-tRNA synthetase